MADHLACRAHQPDRNGPRMGGRQPARHQRAPGECTVDGCDRRPVALGLCGTHYRRQRRTGTTADPYPRGEYCHYCAERSTGPDGLCREHRRRLAGGGLMRKRLRPVDRICVERDGQPVFRHDLCSAHYWRRWRALRRANLEPSPAET